MTNTIPWPSDLLPELTSPSAPAAPLFPRTPYVPSKLPTPILALDVDGPLNPFRSTDRARRRDGFRLQHGEWRNRMRYQPGGWEPYNDLWLSPALGERLARFSRDHDVELVWASMWEFNANTIIGPAMGLPRLPWVDFHGNESRRWKWAAVAEFAAGRPLAWLDDGFTRRHELGREAFRAARRNLPTLCLDVCAKTGIVESHLDAVVSWLDTARLAW